MRKMKSRERQRRGLGVASRRRKERGPGALTKIPYASLFSFFLFQVWSIINTTSLISYPIF